MKKNSDSESAVDVDEEQPVNRHQTLQIKTNPLYRLMQKSKNF